MEVEAAETVFNIAEWLLQAWNWFSDQFVNTSNFVIGLLPDSPFRLLDYTPIQPYLGILNYFFPIDFMCSTLTAWGTCIIVYYSYQSVLKWSNAIE